MTLRYQELNIFLNLAAATECSTDLSTTGTDHTASLTADRSTTDVTADITAAPTAADTWHSGTYGKASGAGTLMAHLLRPFRACSSVPKKQTKKKEKKENTIAADIIVFEIFGVLFFLY